MKLKYKKLRLKTIKDFKKAETLQARGWKPILIGIDSILLEK
jgi:hypothetical protein